MNYSDIQAAFLLQLPKDWRQIETAWNDLLASEGEAQKREILVQAVHRLAGVALSVGYSRIGNAAILVENHLRQFAFQERGALEKLIGALWIEVETRTREAVVEQEHDATQSIKNMTSIQEARSSSVIYLADDDPVLVNTLASQVRHFGYSVQTFTRLQDLLIALRQEIPTAILMDIMFPEGQLAGIETVRALQVEYHNQLPVFFLSGRDDVPTRLHAIRAGGKNYYVKPVDIGALVDDLDKVIVVGETEPFRVLIVDDSEVQAKVNAMHLKKAGIVTQITTNPIDVLRLLDEFLPDLLLLDLYMPECTGLELAQVIRQMKTYVSLPIVYLSAETDREKQLAAVGLGGDDFLTKPIKPDHLISAVTSRITRYRQLRALMLRDSLTGLLNHTSIRERLGQELTRSARHDQPLALGMIDIDNFKKVNDNYGHAVGDRVLKALTHMLTRRLRQSDIIGRYGGEEFFIILPNTEENIAIQIIDELRKAFSLVRHLYDGNEFQVTFSCGVAAFPKFQTPAAISEAADRAMYAAKLQGRNLVLLAE